jgi:rhomboid protease GluP
MPQKTQIVPVAGKDTAAILALAYGSFLQLGWTIRYAGVKALIGYTPRSWKRNDDEISISAADNEMTVKSKMTNNESFDMMGKNKKHIQDFIAAFENVKRSASPSELNEWNEKIQALRVETKKIAEEEIKKNKELNEVMNLSGRGKIYVTYGIMAINVLVFIAMVAAGIDLMLPTIPELLKWGANYLPLTANGEWWRLITCVFLHIGLIHLLFNMYALYTIGVYLEPMLGRTKFIIAYLSTGIFASLASLWWHHPPITSAGASGAIFGMYGVFLALLTTQLVPQQVRKGLLQSIGIFVLYNLVYGMKSGVDNSAHIGGLLSGLVIGYLYYGNLKNRPSGMKKNLIPALIAIASIIVATEFLNNERPKLGSEEKQAAKDMLESARHKDAQKFLDQYNVFIGMQKKAMVPWEDSTLSDKLRATKLKEVSLPEWNKARDLVNEMKRYDVSDRYKQIIPVLQEYADERIEEISLMEKMVAHNTKELNDEYDQLEEKIGKTVEQLNKIKP